MHNVKARFAGVHELDKLGGLSPNQKDSLRKEVNILIIDDRDAESMAETLARKHGFENIRTEKTIPDEPVIQRHQIIVTDVDGVAMDDSNGLKFARHIKTRSPLKRVIISSGQLKLSKYREDLRYASMFDGVYEKTKDSHEKLAQLLDSSIINLYDPSFVWRNVRENLLKRDVNKPDTDMFSVMQMENDFVRQVLSKNKGGTIDNLHWLDALIELGTLSKTVIELLSAIKAISG